MSLLHDYGIAITDVTQLFPLVGLHERTVLLLGSHTATETRTATAMQAAMECVRDGSRDADERRTRRLGSDCQYVSRAESVRVAAGRRTSHRMLNRLVRDISPVVTDRVHEMRLPYLRHHSHVQATFEISGSRSAMRTG